MLQFLFLEQKTIFSAYSGVPLQNLAQKRKRDFRLSPDSCVEEGSVAFAKQILHTINNQLTIVIGRAALLASETEDAGTKKRCEEIETAAQKISCLLNHIPEGE